MDASSTTHDNRNVQEFIRGTRALRANSVARAPRGNCRGGNQDEMDGSSWQSSSLNSTSRQSPGRSAADWGAGLGLAWKAEA